MQPEIPILNVIKVVNEVFALNTGMQLASKNFDHKLAFKKFFTNLSHFLILNDLI